MQLNQIKVNVILLTFLLIFGFFTGCVEEQNSDNDDIIPSIIITDLPSILPDWKDEEYHDYYKTTDLIYDLKGYLSNKNYYLKVIH